MCPNYDLRVKHLIPYELNRSTQNDIKIISSSSTFFSAFVVVQCELVVLLLSIMRAHK